MRLPIVILAHCLQLLPCGQLSAGSPKSGPEPEAGWSLSFSPSWKKVGDISLTSGSRSSMFAIPQLLSGDFLSVPDIGDPDTFSERTYNDGFNNPSAITPLTSLTWFWGYQNPDQIDGRNLSFSATGSESIYSPGADSANFFHSEKDVGGFSPQIDLNYYPARPIFGFSSLLTSFTITGTDLASSFSNFSGGQSQQNFRHDYIDIFDIGAISLQPPTAPYAGTLNGPGPSIPNLPADRQFTPVLVSTEDAPYRNLINSDLDLTTFTLAIGPTFEGEFVHNWNWQLAAGTTLNLHDYSVRQRETLSSSVNGAAPTVLADWSSSDSGIELGIGLFLRASTIYQVDEKWFLSAYAQMETGSSIDFGAGTSAYELSPDSYSFGFGVGRRF